MKYIKVGHDKWVPNPDPEQTRKSLTRFYRVLGKWGAAMVKAFQKGRSNHEIR